MNRAYPLIILAFNFLLFFSINGCSRQNAGVETSFNSPAAIDNTLSFDPLQGRVITTWIDKQHSTMSTLYGNNLAADYARTHSQQLYPPGSILSLVTWRQREDPRWFGANIPARLSTVEVIVVKTSSNHQALYAYQKYDGASLRKVSAEEGVTPSAQSAYLLSQRAAVMP